jgi:acetyl/propionyl-CoA carboxylase alpha subunit
MQYEVRWPDGQTAAVDSTAIENDTWIPAGPRAWDVQVGEATHRVLLIDGPDAQGYVTLRIDGVKWSAQVSDERMLLLERMGMSASDESLDRELLAPMPGKVLSIEIEAGAEVAEGDTLLILEAMKMENVLKSPRAGRVEQVEAVAGEAVEKGAVLITFADE